MKPHAKTALSLALAIVGGIAAGMRCDASVTVETPTQINPRVAAYTVKAYTEGSDPFDARNTVLHEMQHAYDQCIIGDIADCADRAKREVRAVIRSGRCGRGSKIDWACVKDTAKRSVDKFRECRDTSVEDVESYVKFFLEKLKGVL